MKQRIALLAFPALVLISCGTTQEDEIAADNACRLVQRYEEMKAAEGTDREGVTEEFFMSSMENYASTQAPRSNSENVKELMKSSCGEGKVAVFEEIMNNKH